MESHEAIDRIDISLADVERYGTMMAEDEERRKRPM